MKEMLVMKNVSYLSLPVKLGGSCHTKISNFEYNSSTVAMLQDNEPICCQRSANRTTTKYYNERADILSLGFLLYPSKRKFVDAIYIRYSWSPNRLPTECVCGAVFNINYALCCKVRGLITLRHKRFETSLLSYCQPCAKEPALDETTENNLRVDVSMREFWQRMQRAFDVRVLYPFAPRYRK